MSIEVPALARTLPEPIVTGSRPRILCVDDEPLVLEGLSDTLGRTFSVVTATSPSQALDILEREPEAFSVILSDMRMPGMAGSEFLRMARLTAPDAVRILLTGDADVPAAARAINDGQVFRFLTKPCDSQELMRACVTAMGQHRLQTSERVLLQETLRGCVATLAEVLALVSPSAFGRAERAREMAGALARTAGLRDWWEVEVAAMLENLGAVILPPQTAEKLNAGRPLSDSEAEMVNRVPRVTRQLLSKIPRLDGVLDILSSYHTNSENSGEDPCPLSPGAEILRVVLEYTELELESDSADVALAAMRGRGRYDADLLELLGSIIDIGTDLRVREITVRELRVGMTLADAARTIEGGLLLARGQRVTDRLIERLTNLGADSIREPLRVIEPRSEP